MSLNTAHTDGGVVVHQGEMILLHAPSTNLSFSGSDDLKKFGELTGNSYLTTHRLIFLTKGTKSDLKSFSFPFCVLSEVDVEQPVFGSNYLKGKVRAQPNGNWRGEAKWKLLFKAGGAIDFAQGMLKAIHIARQMTAQSQYWNEPPPSYTAAAFMPAPAYCYAPPPSYYGWNYSPNGYAFPPPEAGTVFVNEAPPPYPGLGGFQAPPAQQANPYSAPQQYGGTSVPQQYGGTSAPQQYGGTSAPQQYGGTSAPQQYGGTSAPAAQPVSYGYQQPTGVYNAGYYNAQLEFGHSNTAPPTGSFNNGQQGYVYNAPPSAGGYYNGQPAAGNYYNGQPGFGSTVPPPAGGGYYNGQVGNPYNAPPPQYDPAYISGRENGTTAGASAPPYYPTAEAQKKQI